MHRYAWYSFHSRCFLSHRQVLFQGVNCGKVWRSIFSSRGVFSFSDLKSCSTISDIGLNVTSGLFLAACDSAVVDSITWNGGLQFPPQFYFNRDLVRNWRGSIFKSTGESHFGISSIRFQAIKMYFLPLFFISSFTSHIGDLTRSSKNLERTVPRRINFSGLCFPMFKNQTRSPSLNVSPCTFLLKYSLCRRCSVPNRHLRLPMDFI